MSSRYLPSTLLYLPTGFGKLHLTAGHLSCFKVPHQVSRNFLQNEFGVRRERLGGDGGLVLDDGDNRGHRLSEGVDLEIR